MSPRGEITAVVPAAGLSTRMGEFKPLMHLGGRPVLERVVETLRLGGVGEVLVVGGHRADELGPLAARHGARLVENPDYRQGMFSSVRAGVEALSPQCRVFLVHPVDIPLVRPTTIRTLLAAYDHGAGQVLHPTFRGQRGHPPVLAAELAPRVLAWSGRRGLAGLLADWEDRAAEVPVADEYILADLDTPEHFQRLTQACRRHAIPTIDECLALLEDVMRAGPELLAHSRAVTRLALRLTGRLNRAGCDLDPDLVAAAGLLHDLAKGQPDHATAAARLLGGLGWSAVGAVAAEHMDLAMDPQAPLREAEVVHLADKYFQGDRPTTMDQRFAAKLAKYGSDPAAARDIQRRRETAQAIKARMERRLGRSLDQLINRTAEDPAEEAEHDLLAAAWADTDR